jgi:hypothetical protein
MKPKDNFLNNSDKSEDINDTDKIFVELINEEISYIRNEGLEPGWTVWAVNAAIASLIWLFFSEFEKQQGHFESVIMLFVIFNYLYSCATYSYNFFIREQKQKSDYFRPMLFFSLPRLELIVSVITKVGIILITYYFQGKINILVTVLAYVINVYYLILDLLAPLLEKSIEQKKLFIETRSYGERFIRINYILSNLIYAFLSYAYFRYVLQASMPISASDVRFVCLIFAILYLFRVMSLIQTKSPVLDLLVKIRRDYVLGKIDTLEVKKRIDNALFGLKVNDVQYEYQQLLTEYIDDAEKELFEVFKLMYKLIRCYQNDDGKLSKGT